jgi:hypothetical protein
LKDLRDESSAGIVILERTAVPNKAERYEGSFCARKLSMSSGGAKDSLLLIDFENQTGEAIFDHTLKTALAFFARSVAVFGHCAGCESSADFAADETRAERARHP